MLALATIRSLAQLVDRPSSHFTGVPNRHYDDPSHGLSPRDKTTYDQLHRLSWGHGQDICWISTDRLAERVLVSRNTIKTALASLEDRRKIQVISRGEDGLIIRVFPLFDDALVPIVLDKEKKKKELNPEQSKTTADPPVVVPPLPAVADVLQLDSTPPQNLPEGDQFLPPIKTDLKNKVLKHTEVCLGSQSVATIMSAGDLAGTPLAGLPQRSLEWAAKYIGSIWAVIHIIFSILISYSSEKMSVLNPVALFKWAIKNKDKTFVMSGIKEIVSFLLERISWIKIEKRMMGSDKFNENEFMEIKFFEDYLRGYSKEYEDCYTLDKIFEYYNNVCRDLKLKKFTVWSFLKYRKPVY